MLTCRSCGQHFFEKYYQDLEFARGAEEPASRASSTATPHQNDDGRTTPSGPRPPQGTGTRLVLTNRLLEEADGGPSRTLGTLAEGVVLPPVRGDAPGVVASLPGRWLRPQGAAPAADRLRARLVGVPVVQHAVVPIGGREIEPARKVQAVTVSDVHILAQAMINAAPEGHKKLIIFADSRQDAAFQAGWMQDHARRIRLRHMMHSGHRRERHAAAAGRASPTS